MALVAVTNLVEQMKEVRKWYVDLILGAENELELMINELQLLMAFLRDVRKKMKKDHIFRELDRQIKEAVYDVERIMDICLAKAVEAKAKRTARRLATFLSPKRFNLAKEMKFIRQERLLPLLNQANSKFALVAHVGDEPESIENLRTIINKKYQPMKRKRIVGFEDEEETITGYLIEETNELDVIAIIGPPGQGKTTLARKIYEKDEIRYHFPVRIWVKVSLHFNAREVFLRILRNFFPSQSMSNSIRNEELAQTVLECLAKERFLLVLDDIWTVDNWKIIEKVLPVKNGASKVVITSREMNVALHSSRVREPHMLRFLTSEESWKLLQHEVFGNEEDCPLELRDIGKTIAIKCGGLPLIIVLVGGILIDKLTVKEWDMVLKYMSDSLGAGFIEKRMTDVMELSYRTLPDDLRECFVYLAVFPEDYDIPGKLLTGLWVSEGFIVPRDGMSLEDTAEEMQNDLVSRNLLTVVKTNRMGKLKTFRLPELIRAFCITKCHEENLFEEVKESRNGLLEPPVSAVKNFHRLSFHSTSVTKFLSTSPNGPHVRSFLCFHKQPLEIEPQLAAVIPGSFPRLRILESRSIKFHEFPKKFTKLIHLRFLTMRIDTLQVLPYEITLLWNLVSLFVETKSRRIEMKANIWRMIQLRHVKTKAAIVLDNKIQESKPENLQTLHTLSAESCTQVVSQRAKNLKELGISGNLANVFESDFLANLHNLEKLKLVNVPTHDLPQPKVFPPNLKRLTLTKTSFDWHYMSTLALIEGLETLKLKDNAFCGAKWEASGYSFPRLQLLLIARTNLVIWHASEITFPRLRILVVTNCEYLLEIPEHVGTPLEKLEVDGLRSSAVESAKRIAEKKNANTESKFRVEFDLNIGLASDK